MALINCPECGRETSDKAFACPHCGYPIEKLHSEKETISSEREKPSDFEDSTASQSEPNRCKICGKILIDKNHIYCDDCRENIRRTAYAAKTNTQMKKSENQLDNENILIVVSRWLVAAFIALLAICFFVSYGIGGIFTFVCFMACSFFISPLSRKATTTFPKWLKIVAPIVFFFAAIITTPTSESKDTVNNSEVESIVQSDTEEYLTAEETKNADISSKETIENVTESELISEPESIETETHESGEIIEQDTVYEEIFDLDLRENWNDYYGKYIRTTFEVDRCEDEYIDSSYKDGYLRIYPNNYREFEYGDYITITGKLDGKTGSYIEIKDAHIEAYGNDALLAYNEELSAYNERKAIEAAEYEASFKEEAEKVSYENLARYPDTYKDIKLKITVSIKEVKKKDSLLFADSYIASMSGNEIAIYDERDTKEPKLLEGDKAIIYGYGKGLTEIKTYDRSGIIPKVIDKRKIPAISIEFIEIQ